jgi:hypothetical protein
MSTPRFASVVLCVCIWACSSPVASAAGSEPERDRLLRAFFAAKERQAQELTEQLELKVAPEVWDYFRAGIKGDWGTLTNGYAALRKRSSQYEDSRPEPELANPVWQTIVETSCAYGFFADVDFPLALRYGRDVMEHIKPGSIYFGGTDPGRGVITALSEDHAAGKPFFTITQNALANGDYLRYLEATYGGAIYTPVNNDAHRCFKDYIDHATRRLAAGTLKPGENVRVVENRIEVSGLVAVMSINACLAKVIFDRNSDREVFVEESFPLDWMYPHLVPHRAIFRLNRKPVAKLPAQAIAEDHAFWQRRVVELIGPWLKQDTSLPEVCEFAERIHLRRETSDFAGDAAFLRSQSAQKTYGKLRSAIAELYAWRFKESSMAGQSAVMAREADYAFRQAFALHPTTPETVLRYGAFLLAQSRRADAARLVETALKLDPENKQLRDFEREIAKARK